MSLERSNPFVQSRCPNCDTLYHIDRQTLAEAEGQARCFRCGTVFDALAQQADGETPVPAEEEPEIGAELELTRLVESLEARDARHERESVPIMLAAAESARERNRPSPAETSEATTRAPRTPPLSEPQSEPPHGTLKGPAAEYETGRAVAADDTAPPAKPRSTPDAPGPALPFEIPEDLPELQPTLLPDEDIVAPAGSPARRWIVGSFKFALVLLLLLAGLGQWLWYQPRHLEPLRPYYQQLQAWCAQHDCPLPLPALPSQRALAAFTILQREIAPAEDRPGTLRIDMTFVNEAEFAQAYPDVLITLVDNNGATISERRLRPDDYLAADPEHGPNAGTRLIEPREVVSFELLTEDPGESATGFKLNFL